jgi:hypothetical protein
LTLTTHAIVGAAIVCLMPEHPLLGVSLAFASHFLLDALPHWDYPLRSSCINPGLRGRMTYDRNLLVDLLTIGGDAVIGIILTVLLFGLQKGADFTMILAGAWAGMLPDALQFVYTRFPCQPLTVLQRFHQWIHTSRQMRGRPMLGIVSQCVFVGIVLVGVHSFL